ncbi:AAA family ATPase [Agrobacterium radiobacter]|uniref:AAA family ATPase n=1 Tax=Agrobacterium radiobacter TaxID=362 RepID=UPI003F87B8BA
MYAKSLTIENFKCFRAAAMELQFPGRTQGSVSVLDNINLVLGDNGGGKSSVLRALAISMLGPALQVSGFVAQRLVRRSLEAGPIEARLLVQAVRQSIDVAGPLETQNSFMPDTFIELRATLTRQSSELDRLNAGDELSSPFYEAFYDETSPAMFVVGYGATRFVETGEYSESRSRKSRGQRYQRVAGLFEDNVTLRPMQTWLPRVERRDERRYFEVIELINSVLPKSIRFSGNRDEADDQYLFDFNGLPMPYSSLSDGYKAFIAWVTDLIGYMAEVTPAPMRLVELPGVVLVDEIDLHLHPEWQRSVVPTLAKAFPKLQFVLTSHSPLVASTVHRQNVYVTEADFDGTARLGQLDESVFGRSAEQLLLSSYFGLLTTRPEAFVSQAEELFERAAKGDTDAALTYLRRLSGTGTTGGGSAS